MKKDRVKKLERIIKGFANHHRIRIMILLEEEPELSLFEIAEHLNTNIKTTSEHARRLSIPGLIMKRYEGNNVRHTLTIRGKTILKFLRILE